MPLLNEHLAAKTNTLIAIYRPVVVGDDFYGRLLPGKQFVLRCLDHNYLEQVTTKAELRQQQRNPHAWCQGCAMKLVTDAKAKAKAIKPKRRVGRPRKFTYHA